MDRRTLIKKSAALSAVSAFGPLLLSGPARANTVELGDWKITTYSDGNLQLPVSFLFPDIAKDQLEKLLTANGLSTEQFSPNCNVTIASNGERTVIFDVGAGPNFMSTAGKLLNNLEEQEIDPSSITDIVFTHAHPDHLWGILDDFDEIAFPEAEIHFPRKEWDFWAADDVASKLGPEREAFAVGAKNRMEVMQDQVQLFDDGAEPVPGIEAFGTYGHTPGHMAFAIHSGSENVMVIGDALTNHVVSFLKPDWPTASDFDTAMGATTRARLLDRLAGEQSHFVGYHMPGDGWGRVEKTGTGFRFLAGS